MGTLKSFQTRRRGMQDRLSVSVFGGGFEGEAKRKATLLGGPEK